VEHAIQHNLHTVLNFCIATAPTAPTARFPLILVIGVTSVFDWSEARVNSMNLEETWASDPAISMAGLETDAAKLDRLLQRAQEFLLPYPQACAVLLISDTERFKTPLIFVDFARMLPELRSLLADDAAAAPSKILRLHQEGVLQQRWLTAAHMFTDTFYKFSNLQFLMDSVQQEDYEHIVSLATEANFFQGDIAQLLARPGQEGFVVAEISEECNMLGFVLFKVLKHEGSFVEVHIQYVLIDAKLAPAGLGTAVVATLFQRLDKRFHGCNIKYTVDVKTTDEATHFWLKKKGFLRPDKNEPAYKIYPQHPLTE